MHPIKAAPHKSDIPNLTYGGQFTPSRFTGSVLYLCGQRKFMLLAEGGFTDDIFYIYHGDVLYSELKLKYARPQFWQSAYNCPHGISSIP